MLITIKRKNNNGNTKLNLTGVANKNITGNTIVEYKADVHTHQNKDTDTEYTEYIDHVIKRPNTRTTMATMVVYAVSTR